MTLPFDIENYHKVFSKYPPCLMDSNGRVYGIWMIGNLYRRKIGYHGEYPPSFLRRIHALFPDYEKVLHLFSGTLSDYPGAATVDLNPEFSPTVVDNVLNTSKHFTRNQFDIVIADPPYSLKDAKIYGVPPVNKKMVFREARKVIEEGGILVWLDTQVPIYRKIEWDLLGMIGLFCGTNRVTRMVSFFQASPDERYEEYIKGHSN